MPPPPPPPGPPPPQLFANTEKPKLSKGDQNDRSQLLNSIQGGKKLKSTKHLMVDKSGPAIGGKQTAAAAGRPNGPTSQGRGRANGPPGGGFNSATIGHSAGSQGPMGLGGLFAGGMPQLRQTGNRPHAPSSMSNGPSGPPPLPQSAPSGGVNLRHTSSNVNPSMNTRHPFTNTAPRSRGPNVSQTAAPTPGRVGHSPRQQPPQVPRAAFPRAPVSNGAPSRAPQPSTNTIGAPASRPPPTRAPQTDNRPPPPPQQSLKPGRQQAAPPPPRSPSGVSNGHHSNEIPPPPPARRSASASDFTTSTTSRTPFDRPPPPDPPTRGPPPSLPAPRRPPSGGLQHRALPQRPPASAPSRPLPCGASRAPPNGANRAPPNGANRPPSGGSNRPPSSGANRPPSTGANRPPSSGAHRPPSASPNAVMDYRRTSLPSNADKFEADFRFTPLSDLPSPHAFYKSDKSYPSRMQRNAVGQRALPPAPVPR